jgi:hypothetical protein
MENSNYPVARHSFMYGIYISVMLIIVSLAVYVLELYGQSWTAYVSYAILLGGVILASWHYRDKRMGGFITYGQSFTAGFLAGLYAALIVGVFTYLFMTFMGDEFKAMLLQQSEERILEQRPDISDEEYDMAMKFTENMMKPWWMTLMSVLSNVFFSLVFALITSIFIKRPKPENSVA